MCTASFASFSTLMMLKRLRPETGTTSVLGVKGDASDRCPADYCPVVTPPTVTIKQGMGDGSRSGGMEMGN